jgi:MATE family multidrug resistance protein
MNPPALPRGRLSEVRPLARLAGPIVLSQVGSHLMVAVDTAMIGHASSVALTAAGIASVWLTGTSMLAYGVLHGMDPIVTQAHGAGDDERAHMALRRGVVVALLVGLALAAVWGLTGPALRVLGGQDPEIAALAHRYALAQLPTIPFGMMLVALRQYLQGRGVLRPMVWAAVWGNLFNAAANGLLIYGGLGIPALGLTGAGIATGLTRLVMFVLVLAYAHGHPLMPERWWPRTRRAFEAGPLLRLVRIGLPVGVQMGLEVWAFGASTLMAGWLGVTSGAAHMVALNLASLSFMVPLGVGMAATTRVGNLLGAGEPERAQRAAWTSMAAGAGCMALSGLTFLLARTQVPHLYSSDPEVILAAAAILPIAAAFQVVDGIQVTGAGVLRGMGDTRPAAAFNLVGYWVLGLPLGWWLAFERGQGLAGVWWGLALGLLVVAICLLAWIRARGPARGSALSADSLRRNGS